MAFGDKLKKVFGKDKKDDGNPIKNFKYLDELIHNGSNEIILDADIKLKNREKSDYYDGISLAADGMVIDGNGHTIDAQGNALIFNCLGNNITIKNVILKNAHAKLRGGAISNRGNLTVSGCIFNNNFNAIENSGELTISGCEFNNNAQAVKNSGMMNNPHLSISNSSFNNNRAHDGAAIYNYNGYVDIVNSVFNANISSHHGGAIYLREGEINISDSIFTKNTAEYNGGAIYSEGNLNISKSKLNQNAVNKSGGAIHSEGRLCISKSSLNDNTGGEYAMAGAIYAKGSESSISKSTIKGNTIKYNQGGAIYNEGNFKIFDCKILNNSSSYSIIYNNDTLQVYNTSFKNNDANRDYIIINRNDSKMSIFYGEFIDNASTAIYNYGKSCTIEKTIFERNHGGILNNTELILINPKLKDNGISNQGKIFIKKSSQDLLSKISGEGIVEVEKDIGPTDNSLFDFGDLDEKIHKSNGNEILLKENVCLQDYERDFYEGGIDLDIDNMIIDGNGKTIDGADKSRIFFITGNNITLKNIIFKNGHSHQNYDNSINNSGGIFKISPQASLIIENCEFIDSQSEEDGGAIQNRGRLKIVNSLIADNTASRCGGAIININGKIEICGSLIKDNTSRKDGGAIHTSGEIIISESTLTNNSSKEYVGGAISNTKRLSISKSVFGENTADWFGGAIYNTGSLTIKDDSQFTKNSSEWSGGAIHNESSLTISGSALNHCLAKENGGAIHNEGTLNISGSSFYDCTAMENGGAIYSKSDYVIKDCNFERNQPNDSNQNKN